MTSDPFEALRRTTDARRPRPDFMVRLRRRLETELGLEWDPRTKGRTLIGEMGYLTIAVRDIERAVAFFGELCGWEFSGASEYEGETTRRTANTTLTIGINDGLAAGGADQAVLLHIGSDDAAAIADRVRELGGRVDRVEPAAGGGWGVFSEPGGTRFAVYQPADYAHITPTTSDREPIEVGYYTMSVPDVEAGVAFFSGVFGWEFDHPGGQQYAHCRTVKLPMGLVPGNGEVMLYLRVTDIEAMREQVRTLGGEPGEADESPSGLSAECRDDQGTMFGLWQPAGGY